MERELIDIIKESDRRDLGVVSQLLRVDLLEQYQRAAVESGYSLDVVAKEGDTWFYDTPALDSHGGLDYSRTERVSQIVKESYVAIDIKKPFSEKDHGTFWRKVEELKADKTS